MARGATAAKAIAAMSAVLTEQDRLHRAREATAALLQESLAHFCPIGATRSPPVPCRARSGLGPSLCLPFFLSGFAMRRQADPPAAGIVVKGARVPRQCSSAKNPRR